MGFFPSPVGWNISPARAAGLSLAFFCSGLEHQPSLRGRAESSPFLFRVGTSTQPARLG